eukprot:scpid90061/ scgid8826/ 
MDTWMFTPIVVVTLLLLAGPGALGEQERGPPSAPEDLFVVRLNSTSATINFKAPKQEERVHEYHCSYTSEECGGEGRWVCSRPRVANCTVIGTFFWRYVNESSSLPLIVSRLCAGQSYDIYVNAVNEQFTFGPSLWLYVDGNVDGIWPRPSSRSNTADTSSSPPSPSNPTENPLTIQVLLAGNQTTETPDKLTAGFTTTQLALGGMMLFSLFLIAMLVCRACRLGTREQRWGTRRCPNPATRSRDFDCVVWRQPSGVESTCNDETQMAVMNRKEEEVEDVLSSGGDLQGSLSSQANSQVHVCVFDPEETSRKDQLQCAQNVSDEDRDRISDTWSAAASIESYVFRNNFLVPELANDGQSLSPTPSVARDCYRPPAPPPTPT